MNQNFHCYQTHIRALDGLVVFPASRASRGLTYYFFISRPIQLLGRISCSFYPLNVQILYVAWGIILVATPNPKDIICGGASSQP